MARTLRSPAGDWPGAIGSSTRTVGAGASSKASPATPVQRAGRQCPCPPKGCLHQDTNIKDLTPFSRKLVEEVFGWIKTVATMRKTRFRGKDRVGWSFVFGLAAYNLVRMRNLGMGV